MSKYSSSTSGLKDVENIELVFLSSCAALDIPETRNELNWRAAAPTQEMLPLPRKSRSKSNRRSNPNNALIHQISPLSMPKPVKSYSQTYRSHSVSRSPLGRSCVPPWDKGSSRLSPVRGSDCSAVKVGFPGNKAYRNRGRSPSRIFQSYGMKSIESTDEGQVVTPRAGGVQEDAVNSNCSPNSYEIGVDCPPKTKLDVETRNMDVNQTQSGNLHFKRRQSPSRIPVAIGVRIPKDPANYFKRTESDTASTRIDHRGCHINTKSPSRIPGPRVSRSMERRGSRYTDSDHGPRNNRAQAALLQAYDSVVNVGKIEQPVSNNNQPARTGNESRLQRSQSLLQKSDNAERSMHVSVTNDDPNLSSSSTTVVPVDATLSVDAFEGNMCNLVAELRRRSEFDVCKPKGDKMKSGVKSEAEINENVGILKESKPKLRKSPSELASKRKPSKSSPKKKKNNGAVVIIVGMALLALISIMSNSD